MFGLEAPAVPFRYDKTLRFYAVFVPKMGLQAS